MQSRKGIQTVSLESLDWIERNLLKEAKDALEFAYSPYGEKFRVGAAVLSRNGKVITGSNVGNAAAGPSICAERSALVRANAEGYGQSCITIAVIGKGDGFDTNRVTTPCGICRQVIFEFASRSGIGENFRIIMASTNLDKITVATIDDLLPLAFSKNDISATEAAN